MSIRHIEPPERPLNETEFAEHLVDLVQNQNLYDTDHTFIEAAMELYDRHLDYRIDRLEAPDGGRVWIREEHRP